MDNERGVAMTQQARRANPYPWTWEIPVGTFLTLMLILDLEAQVGRSCANLAAGAGWHVPTRVDLFSSLPGLLGGDARAGLVGLSGPVASPAALWTWVAVAEVLLIAACVLGLRFVLKRWGPGRMKGMATRADAERLLGLTRLRTAAPIIRPDLYATKVQR
jgi:hypothetical protein